MPKFKFKCEKCNIITTKQVKVGVRYIDCSCGEQAIWQMPTINGNTEVLETIDKDFGTEWRADHRDDIQMRKEKYFWEKEVPRLVDSGTYSLETMLENNWLIVNDKGEIEVQNKPPNKR